MYRVTIHEQLILHEYFSKKPKPTKEDKERLRKLHEALCLVVDGMVPMHCAPVQRDL
jgi:hypothetical protein